MNVRKGLSALFTAALFLAGCSGSATQGSAPFTGMAGQNGAAMRANDCGSDVAIVHDDWHCGTILLEPLSFDGSTFTAVSTRKCNGLDLDDAPAYVAASSGALSFGMQSLSPACLPGWGGHAKRPADGWGDGAQTSFIVAYPAGSTDVNGGTPIAGPVNVHDNPWLFSPLASGYSVQAGSSYVFFVARMNAPVPTPTPFPTSPPATFLLVAPLQWNGSAFSNVSVADCSNVTTSSAPSLQATSNGAFSVAGGSVALAPNCVPAYSEDLYVIATQLAPSGGSCGGDRDRKIRPRVSQAVSGWVIGGPASSSASPWVFSTYTGDFATQACATYAFFVGTVTGGK